MILRKIKSQVLTMCVVLFSIIACNKNTTTSTTATVRYQDALFTTATKATVQFDVQPNYLGIPTTLLADVYQPSGDVSTNRAAIIYVHGGGFVGGTRDGGEQPYFCTQLAKKGYVVASIEYRLGYADLNSSYQQGQAQLRGVQDVNSFIRFTKQNAALYKIDPNKIFICGSSAGGAAVLASAFLDYNEQPAYTDTVGVGPYAGKGNLNGQTTKTKAVYSMWGAVTDTLWIKSGDIPVGAIQSINDPCIPWNSVPSSCQIPGTATYGSNAISTRAKNLGIYTTVHGYNSNVHSLGLEFPNIDITISKMSGFFYPLAK